jgi:hypothetical protein
MAMPVDFWKNDQMLNIFRTKPCQRLERDGVCGWRAQCQFSHCPEWPRRQPRRFNYSPEVCPHISITVENGTEKIVNNCSAGQKCQYAHSKEEVLFHPSMFKTVICEEYAANSGSNARQTRNAKKNKCHRYYCPYAHGQEELRKSNLTDEERNRFYRGMEIFPSDVCCVSCTRHWVAPSVTEQPKPTNFGQAPSSLFDVPGPPLPWPQTQKGLQPPGLTNGLMSSQFGANLWEAIYARDVLSTVPNLGGSLLQGEDAVVKPPKDFNRFAAYSNFAQKEMSAKDAISSFSPIQKPTDDPFSAPNHPSYGEVESFFSMNGEFPEPLRVSLPLSASDSPAFIDVPSARCPVGQSLSTKSPPPSQYTSQAEVDKFYYAML